jgi:hypothetical protein
MQACDVGTHLDHLGDAFVPDCKRALEWDLPANGSYDRIDEAYPHSDLHRT